MVFRRLQNYLHLGLLVAGATLGCSDSASRNLTDMLVDDGSVIVNDGGKPDAHRDGSVGECKEWTRTFDGPAGLDDEGYSVAVDLNGNLHVTGRTSNNIDDDDIFLLKLDSDGNQLDFRTYSGNYTQRNWDSGSNITIDAENNISLVGTMYMEGEAANILVRKMDSEWNELWTRMHNGRANQSDFGSGIAVDYDGNIAVTGTEMDNSDNTRIWIREYDSLGNELWTRTYEGRYVYGSNRGRDIDVDSNGNWLVVGSIDHNLSDLWDLWLGKFDRKGNETFIREYSTGRFEEGYSIAVDRDDNIGITGFISGSSLTQRWNSMGEIVWTVLSDPNAGRGAGLGIVVDMAGNFVVTGYDRPAGASHYDALTVSYDPQGNTRWTRRHNGKSNGEDAGYGIALAPDNTVIFTGTEEVNGQQDIVVGKYCNRD